MTKTYNKIYSNFKSNIQLVRNLAKFDEIILEFAISSISSLEKRLKKSGVKSLRQLPTNTLQALNKIYENESIRPYYQEIYNQCIVLLVSYFGSTISDIFKSSVSQALKTELKAKKIENKEIKLTLRELQEIDFNLTDEIGDIIIENKDISFQDMKSIHRAFEEYLDIQLIRDKYVENIIVGQACRHVIVHAGAIADQKLLKQLKGIKNSALKNDICKGDKLQFTIKEIEILCTSMTKYIEMLIEKLE